MYQSELLDRYGSINDQLSRLVLLSNDKGGGNDSRKCSSRAMHTKTGRGTDWILLQGSQVTVFTNQVKSYD